MIVNLAKNRGVPVLKHTDGNVYPILSEMVNAGINGLHPIEPGAMDLSDVKEKYGDKICLIENVDCRHVLPCGSEEDRYIREVYALSLTSEEEGKLCVYTGPLFFGAPCWKKTTNLETSVTYG